MPPSVDPSEPLTAEKRAFLEKEVDPLLDPGTPRVEPRCRVFGSCGGCHLQHLAYSDQLLYKRRVLERAFAAAGVPIPDLEGSVFGMRDPWRYRNKVDLNARVFGGQLRLGFNAYGTSRLVEPDRCPIASDPINEAFAAFRTTVPEQAALKRRLHSLILRSSHGESRAVALYHTRLKDRGVLDDLTRQTRVRSRTLAGAGFVDRGRRISLGETTLGETLQGVDYGWSLTSFFQANTRQAGILIEQVLRWARPDAGELALDLYAGVGLFSLQLATRVREVVAVEDAPSSVEDARENARRLGISNCRILRGQVEEVLPRIRATMDPAALVVLDPPRSGCSPAVLDELGRMGAGRIVYVSCHPESLARDAAALTGWGYRVEGLSLVDMFPQTVHLETVASFSSRSPPQRSENEQSGRIDREEWSRPGAGKADEVFLGPGGHP